MAPRIKETKGAIIKRASSGQTSVARRHPATQWQQRWYVPFPVAHVRATRGASGNRKARRVVAEAGVCDSRNSTETTPRTRLSSSLLVFHCAARDQCKCKASSHRRLWQR
ncbi:hypothetical protein MRX96_044744 [Rhipicephalus microplus]